VTDEPLVTDQPDPAQATEQVRTLRSLLIRHAVDTRPLAVPAYRRLLIGQGTSFVGSMLTQVAVPVQIYALTHSSLYVGFFGLAGLVPIIAFGLYGGAIADVVDRGRLYFWSSLGAWGVTLALLAQTLLNVGNVWLILALVAVQAAAWAIASSARGAIIPRIVDDELVPSAMSGWWSARSSPASSSVCTTGLPTPTASTRCCSPRRCTRHCACRRCRPTAAHASWGCARWPRGWPSSSPGRCW
jgi:hypothetical protein